jgi:hypothetical protein
MLRNIETRYRYQHETASTSKKIAQLEAQTQQEKQKEQVAQGRLRTLDLTLLDEQTRFINSKLVERAFSWSTLLDELESVLADNVRLISIAPTFNDDGTIGLSLAFQSKSGQGMTNTIDRMHRDPQFSKPFPHNESVGEDGTYAFSISVVYHPPTNRGAVPAAASLAPRRASR